MTPSTATHHQAGRPGHHDRRARPAQELPHRTPSPLYSARHRPVIPGGPGHLHREQDLEPAAGTQLAGDPDLATVAARRWPGPGPGPGRCRGGPGRAPAAPGSRAGRPLLNRSKMCASSASGTPAPLSSMTTEANVARSPPTTCSPVTTETRMRSCSAVCCTAFSSSASMARASRSPSAATTAWSSWPTSQRRVAAGRHRRSCSTANSGRASGSGRRKSGFSEAAMSSSRSLRLLQPVQLADHHVDVALALLAGQVPGQQLGVPERDGDRGLELMRGVHEEPALRGEQPLVLGADRRAGRVGGHGAVRVPGAQAVQQREADPDQVEAELPPVRLVHDDGQAEQAQHHPQRFGQSSARHITT